LRAGSGEPGKTGARTGPGPRTRAAAAGSAEAAENVVQDVVEAARATARGSLEAARPATGRAEVFISGKAVETVGLEAGFAFRVDFPAVELRPLLLVADDFVGLLTSAKRCCASGSSLF